MKPYFSHDEGARNDPKLVQVMMELGHEGKSVYWDLVEMLYEQGGYLMLAQCKGYAFALRTDCDLILRLVNDFELFTSDGTKFWSETALRRLIQRNAKSEKAKESAAKRWSVSQRNANALPTHSEGNAIKEKESKGNTTDVVAPATAAALEVKKASKGQVAAGDNDLYTAATIPFLNDPRLFAIACDNVGHDPANLDAELYRKQIRATAATAGMEAGVLQFQNFLKRYLNNEKASPAGLIRRGGPVLLPNQIASNAGFQVQSLGIPNKEDYLKPVTSHPAGQYAGNIK